MSVKLLKNQKGIGMVEVIATLGIAIIVITSLVSLAVYTLRASLQAKLQLQGTKIANRELELLRAKRDITPDWAVFQAEFDSVRDCKSTGQKCSVDVGNVTPGDIPILGAVSTEGTGAETVERYFTISYPNGDPDTIRFHITVTWNIGTKTKSVYLYSDLTNWRGT